MAKLFPNIDFGRAIMMISLTISTIYQFPSVFDHNLFITMNLSPYNFDSEYFITSIKQVSTAHVEMNYDDKYLTIFSFLAKILLIL